MANEEKKVLLKTTKASRFGKSIRMSALGDNEIKVSDKGIISVNEEVATKMVASNIGWDYVVAPKEEKVKSSKKEVKAEVEETEEETEETETEEETEEEDEGVEIDLDVVKKMTGKQLKELAAELNFTEEEEWDEISVDTVKNLRAWMIAKIES